MVEIALNDGEQAIAKQVGAARYATAREGGIDDAKIGPQSAYETDIEGAAAELAFCKAANVFPDLDFGSYRDYDCQINGWTVDVKATRRLDGRLLARTTKATHPAQYYALVTGTFPGPYRMVGLIHRDKLFKPENLIDLGHGATYALEQGQLQPFEDWVTEAR